MKTRFMMMATVVAVMLSSCGGDALVSKSISMKDVDYYGEHKEYIEVVGDSCVIKYNYTANGGDYYEPTITLTFRLVKEVGELKGFEASYENINVKLLDADYEAVKIDDFTPDLAGYDKLEDLLRGNVGDEVKVTFDIMGGVYPKDMEVVDAQATSIEINDLDFSKVYAASSSSSASTSIDDAVDEVANAYNDALEEVADAYDEALEEAADSYEAALEEAAEDMFDF